MTIANLPPDSGNSRLKTSEGGIALFVKTPGLSPVKTRLAASLGSDAAETLHLKAAHAVAAVIANACTQHPLQGYYAVAETAALDHSFWQSLPRLWQGEGGLGERMRFIYEQLLQRHPYVLLVGADIPQMTAEQLGDCGRWLSCSAGPRFAFGPGLDGGFWLFGGNRPIPRGIWTEVSYSQPDTGTQFLNAINGLGDVYFTDSLQDVDVPGDLSSVLASLQRLPWPVPEQQSMIGFMRQFT